MLYDPFGKDYMLYSVKNVVEEHPEIDYNDGVRKLFLYTGGKKAAYHCEAIEKQLKRGSHHEIFTDCIKCKIYTF